jgi:hypothetical protein
VLHLIVIFICDLLLSQPELYNHHRTWSYIIPFYLCMPGSWVDTEYSILWVLYTLSTASTQDYFTFLHSHDMKLTPECSIKLLAYLSTPSTGIGELSIWAQTSAKCKSVREPHSNLPDTPVDLTSASKHYQMSPGPPGAKERALRLCKSKLWCCSRLLQLRRCI